MLGRTNTGGCGGGGGLNFQVIGGTTAPSNPKENTIWVDTDVEITGWDFSAAEPANPAEGMVWFSVGTASTVAFNALKKNSVMVYPLSAKQYVGGAWVDKTAKSYRGGAWVAWWNGQLYDRGNTYTSVTGGYSAYGDGTILTENADHLYIESTGPSGVYNNTPVDMAKYSTITFVWTCVRGGIDVRFQVRSDKSTGGSGWAAGTTITGPDEKQYTTTLDISSLSGSYYVGIGRFSSGGPAKIKIHSIIMS